MKHPIAWALIVGWIPLAIVISGLSLLVYTVVQQNYRESLNDPQIQLAEDAAAKIASGTQVDQAVPVGKVDIAQSLAPWIAVYNETGTPLFSSGELNGALPQPPQGLFNDSSWLFTKTYQTPQGKETRITWQAPSGIRQALVVIHLTSPNGAGFVIAGRNMREVESREGKLSLFVGATWLLLMGSTLVWKLLVSFIMSRMRPTTH